MAWVELQPGEDEQLNAEEYSPYNLPVPDEEGMDRILRRGIQGVKDTLKADPDPLFNQLELVPPGGRRGVGGLPTGAPKQNWQELEAPPPIAKKEEEGEDSWYQRAIYGMERGGAGYVQSMSVQQSESLVNTLNLAEESPENAQQYADLLGGAYGVQLKDGHRDPDEFKANLRQLILEKYKSQQIRSDAMSGIPLSESLAAMSEVKTWGEGFSVLASDPIGIAIEGLAQSLPAMLPGLIAMGLIGPAGALLLGASSFSVERGGMLEEAMLKMAEEQGHDLSTVEGQQALAESPEFQARVTTLTKGAATVGVFDTISGILPGVKLIKGKPVLEYFAQLTSQMLLGGTGEAGKQVITEGGVTSPGDVILEAFLELPGGILEISAVRSEVLKIQKKDAKAKPGTTPGAAPPKGDTPASRDVGEGPTSPSGRTSPLPETDETGAPIDVDVSAEAAPMKVGEVDAALSAALDQQALDAGEIVAPPEITPAPEATQAKQVLDEKTTPETVATTESQLVDEVQLETETDKLESPMINKKALKEKLRKLNTDEPKSIRAVRKAWKDVMEALVKRFPDVKLPLPTRTFGAPGISNFFATLQEQIDLTEAMPDLKEFLDTVLTGTSAEVIDTLNRMTSSVIVDTPSATVGETGELSSQMVSGINVYDAAETERLKNAKTIESTNKRTGKKTVSKRVGGLANRLNARAIVVDELATVVEAGINYLKNTSGLGLIPEGVTALIRRARSYREGSQITKRRTLPSGTVVEPKKFSGKNLDEVGSGLREAADIIARVVASQELNKPKTEGTEAKVETTSSTTEDSTASKKATGRKASTSVRVTSKTGEELPGEAAKIAAEVQAAATEKPVTASKMERPKKPKQNPLGVKELDVEETLPSSKERFKKREDEQLAGTVETEKSLKEQRADLAKMKKEGKKSEEVKKTSKKKEIKVQTKAEKAAELSKKRAVAKKKRAAGKKQTKKQKETARLKAEIAQGEADLAATIKKETVPGAKPEEVLEVGEKIVSGKQSKTELEVAGFEKGTTLAEALEEAGISSKAARVIRGLVAVVKPKQQAKIIQAVHEYGTNAENAEAAIRLIAQIADITGKQPSPEIIAALMEYGEARARSLMEFKEDELQADIDADVIAEAQGMSREDSDSLDELGYATVDLSDDTVAAMSEDDFKDRNFQERAVKALQDREERNEVAEDTKEDKVLFRAMNKMKEFFAGNIGNTVNISEVLQALISGLPTNHRYHILAQRLLRLNMDIPVKIRSESEPILDKEGNQIAVGMGEFKPGKNLTEREIWLVFDEKGDTHGELIERSLHEILHAALWHAYRTNKVFREEINTLYAETVAHFKSEVESKGKEYSFDDIEKSGAIDILYGLKNPEEFMVEAMTNPDFQEKLAGIQSSIPTTYAEKISNIMQRFKDAINKFLGYSIRNNVLERVISAVSINLMSESDQVLADRQRRNVPELFPTRDKLYSEKASPTKRRESLLDAERRVKKDVATKIKSLVTTIKNKGHKINLGWSARDVIERNQRKLFDKGAAALKMLNPLTRYDDAKDFASSLAKSIETKAVKIIKRIVALDNKGTSRLYAVMRDVTKAELYANKPLNHPDNAHLWTTHKDGTVALKGKYAKTAPAARQLFIDLVKEHPKAAKLLVTMAELTRTILNTKLEGSLIAMGEGFKFDEATIKSLRKVRTDAQVDALFPVTEAEDLITLKATEANTKEEKAKKREQLAKAATNEAANKAAKNIIGMTKIQGMYFPLRRYGDYVVSTHSETTKKDSYVSFHTTQAEAESIAVKLRSEGLEVNVSLKVEKNAVPKNIAAVIAEITDRVKDKDTRLALRGALAETLAESVAYASQMKRYNIDGIAADDMGRAFEEYVKVSKYTIGDLVTSHRVSRALVDMKIIQKNEDGDLTVDEAILAGEVTNEIAKQNKDEAEQRSPSIISQRVGLIGFLNFLGAPQYWALNSTQTLTITVPYVNAIWGPKGVTALFKAYGVVFEAVGKTLRSGNPSYEMFVSNLPAAAQKVVKVLEDATIIQSTLAHEFGNTFSPSAFKKFIDFAEEKTGKAGRALATTPEKIMFIMEKVPEAIEHFNRISTALAIYEVSDGDMIAVKDGVQETQFNYETTNRARLLKKWGTFAGSGLVSPIMMFKTHGFGVARLLYGAMIDVVYQKGRNRKQALSLAGGLIVSHTLFAGVAGGFMLYPVTILIGVFNMMFREAGDEFDLEEAVEEFGKEIGGDAVATLLTRGIPAWAGADWHNSVNLGNLIWMGNDRADPSKPGEWAEIVYRQFGPLAQYVGNTVREGALYAIDHPKGSGRDFLEAAIPVKVIRGMLQAWKYSEEGLVTDGALELLSPKDFNMWDIGVTAMGFQSSKKTDTTEWYYRRQAREMRRKERRSVLIRKMVEAIDKGEDISELIDEAISFSLALPPGSDVNRIIPSADMAKYRSRMREGARDYLKLEITH